MNMKTRITKNNRASFIMVNCLLYITLCVVPVTLSIAQNYGEIHGRIMDVSTNEPLPSAHIMIYRGTSVLIGCTSDNDGYFFLKPVPVGTHNVTVKYTGYSDSEILAVMVGADKITYLRDISMKPGYELGPVIIRWTRDLVDPDDPSKKTIDPLVIQSIPNSQNFPSLLSAISSEIYVSEDMKSVHFRGSRANEAVYIIDGVKMINQNAMIPSKAIGNMTVYSGGVPAKYGDFSGGVVIIETASYFDWLARKKAAKMLGSDM